MSEGALALRTGAGVVVVLLAAAGVLAFWGGLEAYGALRRWRWRR